jgi:hypothetical protein
MASHDNVINARWNLFSDFSSSRHDSPQRSWSLLNDGGLSLVCVAQVGKRVERCMLRTKSRSWQWREVYIESQ